ncbi:unnamed protein product [Bursaphelenchus okinawaensis]|uniref:Band 7 domain-containing protein n=1 Tax=Bursaphelenchus okinawaensis TaxID=465554 RepID=A0A811LRX3_9BILA|nr:unnamed protein product [Bursaphelenchus okinawaensis]CAG9127045.1 unnamed protein product [Bursaphelenchus okinawaensis]
MHRRLAQNVSAPVRSSSSRPNYRSRPYQSSSYRSQHQISSSTASEGSSLDDNSSGDEDERSRLMGDSHVDDQEKDEDVPQSIHINVPEFPIATATFRRPRSSSIIGSRHGSQSFPTGPRMGRRFTLNPLIFAKEEKEARRQSLAQLKLSYYPKNMNPDAYDAGLGFCGWFLMTLSYLFFFATFPLTICFCIKVIQEYERAVIFRLGRLIGGGAKGPGIIFVLPCIESYTKVDLRTVSFSVPPQEILTRDSVTVSVDAVVYYRICNATVSVANVENAHHSTRLLAQTALRNMLGTRNLSEILSDRDSIAEAMQALLAETTASWGIKVERVEIKDVRLPVQLQRAMAAEAEATREARAKVIAAEGEQKASQSLHEAATIISQSPAALQLRYLQTLNSVAAEKNSTIVFPLPVELLRHFMGETVR